MYHFVAVAENPSSEIFKVSADQNRLHLPWFFWRWTVIGCEFNGGADNSSHRCFKHRSCHCFCQVLESEPKFGFWTCYT
uniref:Uncharacterized protein n=1 Tax=Nelumbo nucifera TaxID=4432 RepID=A0A822Z6E6_NELNU|nr:TPA_asm: hypothetical protein HUJ06_007739 [Nelumbo nucifera]